jgi:hypothetical protein
MCIGGSCPLARYPRKSAARLATALSDRSTAPAITARYHAGFSARTCGGLRDFKATVTLGFLVAGAVSLHEEQSSSALLCCTLVQHLEH